MNNLMEYQTSFGLVSEMNAAFGNPRGDWLAIDKVKLKSQCKNILDEYNELMEAIEEGDLYKIRDALCDIHVFAYGAHHIMGLDADKDMDAVVFAVMTRFIKDPDDCLATVIKHHAKGVTDIYFEGDYPEMIMKSGSDQPDAPKGKFLKSASYKEPEFEEPAQFTQEAAIARADKIEETADQCWERVAGNEHIWYNSKSGWYTYSDEAEQLGPNYVTATDAIDALTAYATQLKLSNWRMPTLNPMAVGVGITVAGNAPLDINFNCNCLHGVCMGIVGVVCKQAAEDRFGLNRAADFHDKQRIDHTGGEG